MIKQLNDLSAIIDTYHGANEPTGEMLNKFIKDTSSLLFYLTTERINAHKKYNSIMFTKKEKSVAAQTIVANEQVPELYELRYIIKAGYECLGAMRSNLVSARKEKEYTGAIANPRGHLMISAELEKERKIESDETRDKTHH